MKNSLFIVVISLLGLVASSSSSEKASLAKQADFIQSSFDRFFASSQFLADIPITINQRAAQADPANSGSVIFEIVFDEPMNPDSFTASDLVNSGTATLGTINVTNNGDEKNFTVTITTVNSDGTIILTIPMGTVEGLVGFVNAASTSTDNSVTFESTAPSVTIDQKSTQVDPGIFLPVEFDIVFSEPINNATFTLADFTHSGTATGVTWGLVNSGDNKNYTLQATAITAGGTLVPTIGMGLVEDLFANTNSASTSTDGTINYLKPITNLAYAGKSSSSIEMSWVEPAHNSMTVSGYDVFYRLDGAIPWTLFENTTSLESDVIGLTASSIYEFTVVTKYNLGDSDLGTDGTTVDGSIYLREETGPNIPLFDPSMYTAINVGGADDSKVVAMVDNTDIDRNGVFLVNLDAGQTHSIASSQFDLLEANKPIFVSGGLGSGGGVSGANIAWHNPSWAGTNFHFNSDRDPPFIASVWAAEAADVYLDGVLQLSFVSGNSGNTFSIPAAGSYEITSTGVILVFIWGEGAAGTRYTDPMPLFPAAKDLVGFASTRAYLTNSSGVTSCLHSNSTACAINSGTIDYFSPVGTSSYYQSNATRVFSDDPIFIRSRADNNGYCGAPFMPRSYMRSMYAINTDATYVALASTEACSVEVLNTSGTVVETINFTRSGADTEAPYFGRTGTTGSSIGTNTLEGYLFRATDDGGGSPSCKFAAWYQPATADLDGAENDETILYGTDDFIAY